MKRQIVWPVLVFLILTIPLFVLAYPQPPAGNTGAPGDSTCASCHSGSAGGGTASVTFPSGTTYSPGVKQHLSVTVNDISHNAWSFQLTARLASNTATQGGSFTATDATNTIVVSSGTVQDMETTASGISQSTWNFDWTPPTTNVGNVSFYLIGLGAGGSGGATSGNGIYTATYTLTPAATADFSLSPNPSSLTIAQGATGTSTINVTPANGFNGTVAFSASGLPSGVTASFNSSGVMTLTVNSTATTGTSTVTVTGTSGSLTHTTTVGLTVSAPAPNFTLSASPSILAISQGATGTSTITVTPQNGFSGTVTYTASGLPSGVTASFASNVMTVTASSTAAPGSSTVTVTGTSGSLSHTTTVNLSVSATVAPDFSLSPTPNSVSITQGSSGKTSITMTPVGGFNGSVNFTASGLPSGVTASFASSILTLTASSTAATGTSTITVTGASGSLTHTTTLSLTVSAASTGATLTAMPSSLSFAYTLNGSAPPSQNISVTTGSSLTFSVVTSGAWLSGTPSGGTGSRTIAVSVKTTGLVAGTYNGSIVIASAGATGSPITIPVTLTVTSSTQSSFTVSPSDLQFTAQSGGGDDHSTTGGSAAQKLAVTSLTPGVAYSATAGTQTGGNWLVLGSASSVTPGSITTSVRTSGLPAGTYHGSVTVTPTSSLLTPRQVPVTLIVGSPNRALLNVWPRSLAFSFTPNGSESASKTVHVTSSGAQQPFTATTSGGSWLNVSPGSTTTPSTLTVSIDAHGLATGSYTGVVTVTAGSNKYSVNVTAHVSSGTGSGGDGSEAEAEIAVLPTVNDPSESGTVGSQWLIGAGATTSASNTTSTSALALSKTANAPAGTTAGAQLVHAESLTALTGLGFDLRSGSHCTATSPRFVVVTADDITHHVAGCASGATQPAPSTGWVRVSFDPTTQATPAIIPGQPIKSISIVLDEGPEATSTPGSGLAVLDNIKVNGVTVGKD